MKAEIKMIKVADVIPTADNPRKIAKNDSKVMELAESIKANGLLQPVVCRPYPSKPGKWDLRAGFRRFLAHQKLGLTEIMALISPMDDKTAIEVTVTENLQRENLTPLEEAHGIAKLMEVGKDIREIAAEIGKSATWVIRRAKLKDLSPEWVNALENDPNSNVKGMPAANLELIARFDAKIQNDLLEHHSFNIRNCESVHQMERLLADYTHRLKLAPWDLEEDTPQLKACIYCGKRSSCHPGLFDDELDPEKIKADDTCLDPACWNKKGSIWLGRHEIELRKKYPNLVKVANGSMSYAEREELKGVLPCYQYQKAKKTEPGSKPAIIVVGPGLGKMIWIKENDYGQARGSKREKDADGKVKPLTLAEKRKQLLNRRRAWVVDLVSKELEKSMLDRDDCKVPLKEHALIIFAAAYGMDEGTFYEPYSTLDKTLKRYTDDPKDAQREVWSKIVGVIQRRLNLARASDADLVWQEALMLSEVLGMPGHIELMAQAEKAIPEPKSWAAEAKKES